MSEPNKKPKFDNKHLFQLSLWLAIGAAIVVANYFVFSGSVFSNDSGNIGWLNLLGGGVVLMTVLLMLIIVDLLYAVLFLRWLLFSRKYPAKDKTVKLP